MPSGGYSNAIVGGTGGYTQVGYGALVVSKIMFISFSTIEISDCIRASSKGAAPASPGTGAAPAQDDEGSVWFRVQY